MAFFLVALLPTGSMTTELFNTCSITAGGLCHRCLLKRECDCYALKALGYLINAAAAAVLLRETSTPKCDRFRRHTRDWVERPFFIRIDHDTMTMEDDDDG